MHRVEEVVADAAVHHVDALLAAGRTHVDALIATHEVAPFDQFDPHLTGQEGVLEVGRVVDAGGQHDDGRIVDPGRRGGTERFEQALRVVRHATDAMTGEQLGEDVRHRPPVFDDVGDPRRRAEVVLEHAEATGVVAHEVDPRDVDPDAARGIEAGDAAVEVRRARHQTTRDHAVGEDLARPVDVGEEPLEREDALAYPGLDDGPFVGVDDPGHQIEREGPLLARVGERDPLVVEGAVARRAPEFEVVTREGPEHLVERFVVRPRLVRPREHLVPGAFGRVAVEEVSHRHVSTGCTFRVHFGKLKLGVGAFFESSYPALATPSWAIRTVVDMDEQTPTSATTPSRVPTRVPARPPGRRKPRAAGARKTAAALSVAAMLSLGGVLAWHDGQSASTTQAAAASTKSTAAATNATGATSGTSSSNSESDDSTSSSASTSSNAAPTSSNASSGTTTSHTTTSGS